MNDNLLIAAVLREVADIVEKGVRGGLSPLHMVYIIKERAAELDPPEKNETPA